MKVPEARDLATALHLVGEAQELLRKANTKFPDVLPGLLREIADKLEGKDDSRTNQTGPKPSPG
jgi:hypothetical protein